MNITQESTGDLKDAAKLMATSELNKEDLTEQEIYNILLKNSEDGVKEKIGFWAMPLPDPDDNKPINKKYLGKKGSDTTLIVKCVKDFIQSRCFSDLNVTLRI